MTTTLTTTLVNREVIPTCNALTSIGKFPAGLTALKVARIIAALMPEARTIQKAETDLLEEFAARDDEGVPKTLASDDGERTTFLLDPARRAEYLAKHRELMDASVELRAPRLTAFELDQVAKKVGLDPHLTAYLLPFVDEPPSAKDTDAAEEA